MGIEGRTTLQSVLRGWPWIVGAALVSGVVISAAWLATPEVFRTSAELRICLPSEQTLGKSRSAYAGALDVEGRRFIALAMGGEVREAVGRSQGALYDIDTAVPEWYEEWAKVWEDRVRFAGPVDGGIFLIVDDQDGERGVALAKAVLGALEAEWRRQAEVLRREELVRLDRLIDQQMTRLAELINENPGMASSADDPLALVLAAERDLIARNVAAFRLSKTRVVSSGPDDPLPWVIVGDPLPYEYRIRRNPPTAVILSALAFVLLVSVGWVAWDRAVPR